MTRSSRIRVEHGASSRWDASWPAVYPTTNLFSYTLESIVRTTDSIGGPHGGARVLLRTSRQHNVETGQLTDQLWSDSWPIPAITQGQSRLARDCLLGIMSALIHHLFQEIVAMNNFARVVFHLLTAKATSRHLGSFTLTPQEHQALIDLAPALRAPARDLATRLDRAAPPEPWAESSCLSSEPAHA